MQNVTPLFHLEMTHDAHRESRAYHQNAPHIESKNLDSDIHLQNLGL